MEQILITSLVLIMTVSLALIFIIANANAWHENLGIDDANNLLHPWINMQHLCNLYRLLDSIISQIEISGLFIFSKTQFINSILFIRSRLYVESSFYISSHLFDSSISFCKVCCMLIESISGMRIYYAKYFREREFHW